MCGGMYIEGGCCIYTRGPIHNILSKSIHGFSYSVNINIYSSKVLVYMYTTGVYVSCTIVCSPDFSCCGSSVWQCT